ncbi:MAG: response regulator [Thermodesulfobacteriota bacterium]
MVGTNQRTKIIAVLDDLFFTSKIKEAAKSLNSDLEFTKNTDGLIQKLKSEKPSLIIFDLNSKACNPLETIKELKSSSYLKDIPVLGYLSHVQTDLKDEADKAGCDLVLPRSKFSKDLKEILTKYLTLHPSK